ncbi:dynamin family protein [Vannielia litorea]|uniref:dynamin family protein n=1 Tax=Vannielia litorea TaxID=1217970 RepID=UPI001C93E5F2|nr:dynamin family protein [Vannielia litorea]MBY6154365.1 dynamin family protein [Vannielia litorea]
MQIAPKLKAELEFLHSSLDSFEKCVDRKGRQNVRDLREKLNGWAARVAVIGQVKAGKSTFMNALLQQDDFLPSDVNPWTSVVTNIRVNIPGDPVSGAKFDFFDEKDWQEIIDGGSRIRKLTEQLLPGFDTDLLKVQSEQMKQRAQRRLGQHYHTLLGTSHEYDFLTPDLLKRYVCAGPGSDEGLERDSLGRYAALTKVANAYMRLPEFQVPTIVTDTPGVNDPFLVRDEFTCRSLDKSDVFLVALSAHQPLTDVDIALIRILAKQDEKDVLIFVNRIDELDDYNLEVPKVMQDVERRLRKAIPNMDFRVVAGSAHMANVAMRMDDEAAEARDALDTPELMAYLQTKYGKVPMDQADRLLLASGLDDVKRALSETIDNGVGRGQLAQLLGDIRAELSAAQFVAKKERDTVHSQVESVQADLAEEAAQELAADIDKLNSVNDALEEYIENADRQIELVISKSWSKLESKLVGQIDTFVEGQQQALADRVFRDKVSGGSGKALEIDLAPLQTAIEQDVTAGFQKSRAGTDVALSNCLHACRQKVQENFKDEAENIALDSLPYDEFSSTLLLAKKSMNVDLITDRGWKFWAKKTVNVDKTMEALRAIAAEELRPPVEKILGAFNEAQVERATAGMSRVRVFQRMIEVTLNEQTHQLKRDKMALEKLARDPAARAAMSNSLQSKIEVLQHRLINLAALDTSLQRPKLSSAA